MNSLRTIAIAAMLLSITACSGSGGNNLGGLFGGNGLGGCNPNTQVTLARPITGQSGVGSINLIEIVASGSNNTLYQTYQSWQLQVQDSFGNVTSGGNLNLVPDRNGYQPYPMDFYYASSFPKLPTGVSYTVYLIQHGLCSGYNVGGFST